MYSGREGGYVVGRGEGVGVGLYSLSSSIG